MEPIEFPSDFSEFLQLLNAHHVEYLLVGGFAVALHGYDRKADKRASGRSKDLADLENLP